MMPTELPQGRYLSCAFAVPAHAGGQTRALLMRNRILAREGGVRPEVLTLGAVPDNSRRRESLLEQGLLLEEIPLLNIYEHYREHGWGDSGPGTEPEDLSRHRIREDTTPDGKPWRTVYQVPGKQRRIFEYLREDGSPYLRIPRFTNAYKWSWPKRIDQLGTDGSVVGQFGSVAQFFRRWIRDLVAEDERAFVFIDSRYVVPHLVPIAAPRIHLVYLMHNIHVSAPRRWDSPLNPVYKRVLDRIDGMDAMVTLTERQRDDIAMRRGRTSNMFVVPNPVVMPAPPAPRAPRDPHRVTIVARLEKQKRLTHAIRAFAEVVKAVPEAHLDIYGAGSQQEPLAAEIETRGLGGSVVLRGFDPRASEALWTSSLFLMTSSFEGYPLATLESMSRGCPVVSYDIRYGPREQITDGVEGFLVPSGDIALLAQRVIELLRSPELVERMSAAASRRAEQLGPTEFLARWGHVLHTAVEHRPLRTRIDAVQLELERLRLVSASPWRRRLQRGPAIHLGAAGPNAELELACALRVEGRSRETGLDAAALELAWVEQTQGTVTELPLAVTRSGSAFRLRALAPVPAADARLRLRLTWRNSAWETDVAQVARGELKRPAER